ncbi:MAG: DNA-processing protein DprA [Alphaproteobacteria bacterium]|nr:DNA-processing protein DprA [Alphaproteobacteria bacterium]
MNPPRQLTDNERRDWLRLSRAENVGPITFRQLMRRYGSARAALDALPQLAQRGGKKNFTLPPVADIDQEIARAGKINARFIAWGEADYPEALSVIEDAPPVITIRGHAPLLHKRAIGIVGARNASLNGRKMAETLARELGQQGIVIASGLARGIDASAHAASLTTGTIAVVAGGVDVVYPQENAALYAQIAETGCILSDMPLGVEPINKLFPRRNRLISGLSLGVVVVEAALKSGSLITARMALEQGREVFAVPGSPLDPRCTGTNDLIRQGAVLTERADDILTHIHSLPQRLAEPKMGSFEDKMPDIDAREVEAARAKILENLSPSPVSVDELMRECQVSPMVLLSVLLELELAGRVERHPGNKVVWVG